MIRADAVNELKRVFRVLVSDLDDALKLVRDSPTPFAHRTLFRTYFAYVEGFTFQLRQVTLATLQDTPLLTEGELALLREQRYQLDRRGEPEAKQSRQSVLPNLLFSIRCYAKNHGATYQPDISHHEWESMKKAVAVRDRLTHPKSAEGLDVTEADVQIFEEGASWWKRTLREMFSACDEADEFYRKQPGHE
jgi:hypothetical protein